MTLGSSVPSQGLDARTRSRTARLKIECSMTWYLRMLAGERPAELAAVTQSWTVEGRISTIGRSPKNGRKCLWCCPVRGRPLTRPDANWVALGLTEAQVLGRGSGDRRS